MWVDFHHNTAVPYVSFADARADGTHTEWSAPQALPQPPNTPQGATYLLPHVAPDGTIYTTVTNFPPKQHFCCTSIFVDKSTDGGRTWSVVSTPVNDVMPPSAIYPNTTFRDGIEDTFAVGNQLDAQGQYPLYVAYEDFSAGVDNVMLTASYCVNTSIQFYTPRLSPIGHNIRISQNTFDPQLNSPHVDCATCETTFLGDYFGNTVGPEPGGAVDFSSFVSTYDDGTNPSHYQQQIVAAVAVP